MRRASELSPAELAIITNGCGLEGFQVPDFGAFDEACAQHDLDYWVGGTESDRRSADADFLIAMRAAVRAKPWYLRPWLYWVSGRYYRAVADYGWMVFYYTEHPRGEAELATILDGGL